MMKIKRNKEYLNVGSLVKREGLTVDRVRELLNDHNIYETLAIYQMRDDAIGRVVRDYKKEVNLYQFRDGDLWIHLGVIIPALDALELDYDPHDMNVHVIKSCTVLANRFRNNPAFIAKLEQLTNLHTALEDITENDSDADIGYVMQCLFDYELMSLSYSVRGVDR